jgi:hypothetical protein
MAVALVGVGGTIAGVVLGWFLSRFTAREVAREERQWQEAQMVRERQEAAASQLRAAVIEAQEVIPLGMKRPRDAAEPISDGFGALRNAWTRASILRSDDIDERFHALDMALFMAIQDTTIQNREAINFWPLSIALVDLRKALDAYLRRESQPQPEFPTSKELVEIAGSADVAIDQIRSHLSKQRRGS